MQEKDLGGAGFINLKSNSVQWNRSQDHLERGLNSGEDTGSKF